MKKFFTYIICFSISFSSFFLTSCIFNKDQKEEIDIEVLEDAMEELEDENYTANVSMNFTAIVKYGEDMHEINNSINMYLESSQKNAYTEVTLSDQNNGDEKGYSYAEIINNKVYGYSSEDGETWRKEDTISLSEYKGNQLLQVDFDVDECFEYDVEKEAFVGDTKKLNKELKELKSYIASEIVGSSVNLDDLRITKYEIEVEDGQISKIKMNMSYEMSDISGIDYKFTFKIIMKLKDIGHTKVTVPDLYN